MALNDRRETLAPGPDPGVVEEVEVRGHIVDSLLLPKILDRILQMGGTLSHERSEHRPSSRCPRP